MNTLTLVYLTEHDERRTIEMAQRWHPPHELVEDPKTKQPVNCRGVRCLHVLYDRSEVNHGQLTECVAYLEEAIAYYESDGPVAGVPKTEAIYATLVATSAEAAGDLREALELVRHLLAMAIPKVDRKADF